MEIMLEVSKNLSSQKVNITYSCRFVNKDLLQKCNRNWRAKSHFAKKENTLVKYFIQALVEAKLKCCYNELRTNLKRF